MVVPKRTRIYKIVGADSAENLEKEVNKLLDAGWDLVGGVFVTVEIDWMRNDLVSAFSRHAYMQTMITTL